MSRSISQSHGFNESVQTKSTHNAPWQAIVNVVRMPMLDSERNDIQQDLREKTGQDQATNDEVAPRRRAGVLVVEFGQKVQQREREQVSAGERVEQLNMRGAVEVKEEKAERAEDNAGEEQQVIHSCKSFAITAHEKPSSRAARKTRAELSA